MFTGIVECIGKVVNLEYNGQNVDITVQSAISSALKIDQSVLHNGTCLTVVATQAETHTVTAIAQTLGITNLGELQVGSYVNLERAMLANSRFDGHFVQGHIDQTATCVHINEVAGSWYLGFVCKKAVLAAALLVAQGSVCVDGVSLTVANLDTHKQGFFEVAIIPYTFQNTLFKYYSVGSCVNIEFDMLGKYVLGFLQKKPLL